MIFRPAGLWPSKTRQREFSSEADELEHEQEALYDASK
jgi:hypothetical protein